ncbi:hypothetical protein J2768_000917 [Agrobacterium tumefaciens]|nr:hypothetical protein [Agrobacterium tumefaciens]MBP2538519.1 hypothetical protein [Agrobacterium tumefaciens]
MLVSTKRISLMNTKFRLSDLVPAGFIAERITHIDDETCIFLSGAGATASCPACGRTSQTAEADIAAKPLISLCQEGESDFSSAHGGLAVTRCSAVSEYSPSSSATDCLLTQDEPDVSSISSTI